MEPLAADDPPTVGAYRLLGRLGSGGMGRVYLGRSIGGRTVAVKVVHPHFALDTHFRARFAREVAAARVVGGAWTAPVLDADPESEVPWVATGYVAGPDLHRTVNEHGPLPERSVRALGAGLAEALAAVHSRGLVHRDVKPSNVLLAVDGPRLIDFGIARATDASAELTATGVSVGSPGYMSPEQVLGKDTGPSSDVFSLGAVLAFASSGNPPFPGTGAAQLLYRVVHEDAELDGVPPELRELLAACLAKEPSVRPAPEQVAPALAGPDGAVSLVRTGWLPGPVLEGISRQAVRLLDLETSSTRLPGAPPPAYSSHPAAQPAVATMSGTFGPPGSGYGPVGTQLAAELPYAGDASAYGSVAGPAPDQKKRRRRWWPPLAASVLVLGGVAYEVFGPGFTGTESDSGAVLALPDEFAGTWEGELTIGGGLGVGPVTLTLQPGAVGEEIGVISSSDILGLTSCSDLLTLRDVTDTELVFDALASPESSERFCVQGVFGVTLRPEGEHTLHYSTEQPEKGGEAELERTGGPAD